MATRRRPDPQTIYKAACCTDAFTATVLSLLEQARRVSFDGTFGSLHESFPQILEHNPNFAAHDSKDLNLGDLLSHCTGLAAVPFALRGVNGSVFVQHEDILHIFANLPSVSARPSEWRRTEWSYAVVACLIDIVSHLPWTKAVDDILGRLGLMRTYTNRTVDDNYARTYKASSEKAENEIDQEPIVEVEDSCGWSGAVRTCVTDMLRWCRLLITASHPKHSIKMAHPSREIHPVSIYEPRTLTKERILRALWTIQQPDRPLVEGSSQMYATGLYTFTLHTTKINTVSNSNIIPYYRMGKKSTPRKVIGHTGDIGSFTSAYWVFPETESAVVVLTNANSANGDPSNIVAQVLIQALFELQPPIDYVQKSAEIISNAKLQWETTVAEWTSHRKPGPKPKHPNAYIGEYTNSKLRMSLHFVYQSPSEPGHPEEERLIFWINGINEQKFSLYHYHEDSWTFLPSSREECLRLGYGIYIPCWWSFVLTFGPEDSGHCHWVRWRLDPDPRVTAHLFSRVGGGGGGHAATW